MFFSSTWWQHSPVSKQTGITSQQAAVYSHLLYSRYGAALLCLSVSLCFMQIPKEISVLRKTVFNDSVQWTVSQEGWMVICIQFKLCHDLFFFFKSVCFSCGYFVPQEHEVQHDPMFSTGLKALKFDPIWVLIMLGYRGRAGVGGLGVAGGSCHAVWHDSSSAAGQAVTDSLWLCADKAALFQQSTFGMLCCGH